MEDALSDLSTLSSQSEAVNRALVSARDTAALANERYQRGLSSYLDVVDAQRAALQAERQEAQLAANAPSRPFFLPKRSAADGNATPPRSRLLTPNNLNSLTK